MTLVKNLPTNAVDVGSIPGFRKIPWKMEWKSTPVFLSGESHRQRILAGYSPWGCTELGITEQLSMHITVWRCVKSLCNSLCKPLKWRQWHISITLILGIRLKWSTDSRNVNFLGYFKFTVIFSVTCLWYLFKVITKVNNLNHGLFTTDKAAKSSCQIF